jgi:hypothetical protein
LVDDRDASYIIIMASLGRAVLLASLLPFSLVAAQTIVKDGKTIRTCDMLYHPTLTE